MISNERIQELIQAFFEDHDHGREAMQNATVAENICFIDYLEEHCIPKAKEINNEDDLKMFTEYVIHFRMLTLEKILNLDKMWIVVSQGTSHFYAHDKDAIVLVDTSGADYLIGNLAEQNFDVEIREITGDDFIALVEDMQRLGFQNIQFTDGRLRPLVIPRDTIFKAEKSETTINPDLYIESLIFLQHVAKFRKEDKNIAVQENSPLTLALQKATLLVPAIVQSRDGDQMQVKYPFLNTNVEGQKILPVLTDHKEYDYFVNTPLMKDYASLDDDKKVCIELPFVEVYRIFKTDNLFAIAINPVGINLVINRDVMGVATKNIELHNNPNVLVERNGEEKLLKNVQFFTYTTKDNSDPQVSIDFYVKPIEKTFGSVISQTFKQTISTCKMIYASLGGLLTGKFGLKDMSGPIGIASAVTTVASESLSSGFMSAVNSIIYVMMIITVNLGLFNMLPFPALDGGRFVFLIIEAIRGKSVPRKVEAIVNGIGMGLLILLMILITANDIFKLIW